MAEIKDYSTTAGNNNSASPNGMPESMAPSGVNDSWREGTARLKRWYDDISAVNSLAGGTTAYTLAASRTISAYAVGDVFLAVCNATNTGAPTLNVDSVGAKSIVSAENVALTAGQLVEDGIYQFAYDATNDTFICLNPSNPGDCVLLAAGSVASAATLDITGLTSAYREVRLVFDALKPATDSVALRLRLSDDGGSTYEADASDYAWAYNWCTEAGTDGALGDDADSSIELASNAGNAAAEEISGEITFKNPSAATITQVFYHVVYQSNSPVLNVNQGSGQLQAAGATTAFRLLFSSGNIATMNYAVYGLRV